MRPEFPGWNEASEQQLIELAAASFSAASIARKMGTTRNAIIGKCDRLKIALKGDEARQAMRIKRGGQSFEGGRSTRAAVAARPAAGYALPSAPKRFSWEQPLDGAPEPA